MIDDPGMLRLISAIDPSNMGGDAEDDDGEQTQRTARAFYLDALDVKGTLRSTVERLQRDLQMAELGVGSVESSQTQELDLKRSRTRRLEHLLAETPDMFLRLDRTGDLTLKAVANIDRRPPTLCESFTVLKMSTQVAATTDTGRHPYMEHASFVPAFTSPNAPCYECAGHLLLYSCQNQIDRYRISPALLFDGLQQGISAHEDPREAVASSKFGPKDPSCTSAQGFVASTFTASSPDAQSRVVITREANTFLTSSPEKNFAATRDPVVAIAWSDGARPYSVPALAIACPYSIDILGPKSMTAIERLDSHTPRQEAAERWTKVAFISTVAYSRGAIHNITWTQSGALLVQTDTQNLLLKDDLIDLPLIAGTKPPEMHSVTRADSIAASLALRNAAVPDDNYEALLHILLWGCLRTAAQAVMKMSESVESGRHSEDIVALGRLEDELRKAADDGAGNVSLIFV